MGNIPTRKQFKSWVMPTRINIIIGLFALLIPFIIFLLDFLINKPSNNYIDSSTITNQIDSSRTSNFIHKTENKKNDNILVYSISGVKNYKLEKLIENSLNISFDNNSNNIIEISQTGQVQLLSEHSNSYIYTGGFVGVSINNNSCFEFKDYQIPAMRANPKSAILNELNKVISSYVEENVNEFSKRIVECIKG